MKLLYRLFFIHNKHKSYYTNKLKNITRNDNIFVTYFSNNDIIIIEKIKEVKQC